MNIEVLNNYSPNIFEVQKRTYHQEKLSTTNEIKIRTHIKRLAEEIESSHNEIEVDNKIVAHFFKKRKINTNSINNKKCTISKEELNEEKNINFENNLDKRETFQEISSSFSKNSEEFLPKEFKGDQLYDIRFSQRKISSTLSDSTTFLFEKPYHYNNDPSPDLTFYDILRTDGWNERKSRIDAILMPDKKYTSFDNRRLAVAKTVSLVSHSFIISANTHVHSEQAPSAFLSRANKKQILPEPLGEVLKGTYGHAITSRIQLSSSIKLQESERYGFDNYPVVVTGFNGKGIKKIFIDGSNNVVLK